MTCPNCGVTIGCKTDICPLCHTDLLAAGGDPTELKRIERAYPTVKKFPLARGLVFELVYIILALVASIVALSVEWVLAGKIRFSFILMAVLLYLYVLFRYTIKNDKYFTQKVALQALVLSVVVFSVRGALPDATIILNWVLPVLYLVSMLLVAVYILIHIKAPRRHLINLLSLALLGFLPFALGFALKEGPSVLSMTTAGIGGVVIICSLVFSFRKVISELKRIFHV